MEGAAHAHLHHTVIKSSVLGLLIIIFAAFFFLKSRCANRCYRRILHSFIHLAFNAHTMVYHFKPVQL